MGVFDTRALSCGSNQTIEFYRPLGRTTASAGMNNHNLTHHFHFDPYSRESHGAEYKRRIRRPVPRVFCIFNNSMVRFERKPPSKLDVGLPDLTVRFLVDHPRSTTCCPPVPCAGAGRASPLGREFQVWLSGAAWTSCSLEHYSDNARPRSRPIGVGGTATGLNVARKQTCCSIRRHKRDKLRCTKATSLALCFR